LLAGCKSDMGDGMPIAAAIASASPSVRFRAKGGSRRRSKADALASSREAGALHFVQISDTADRHKAVAETLDRLLVALEAPPVDDAARARLARSLDRHGEEHLVLLVRTIIESEGNAAALVEPVIGAVSSVMVFHPEWANRGLAWIEAFDSVPLMALRKRLAKVFEPPKAPKVKPRRRV
jgi:hypothetical protein